MFNQRVETASIDGVHMLLLHPSAVGETCFLFECIPHGIRASLAKVGEGQENEEIWLDSLRQNSVRVRFPF